MITEILRHEIVGIAETDLKAFAAQWTISKNISRGEYLYPKGMPETNIYFIESGSFKIGYEVNGQEMVLGFGYENTFIFDLPSFFTGKASSFYIEAIKKSKLIGIRKADFEASLDSNLIIAKYWRKRTELIMLDLVEREIDILTSSPKTRFERLQNRNPTIFQKIPHKYIAAYLRMSAETLSRLKKC
jgi:CRP/FNR family transcriptional regulator, anaerobic regulatory protein